MSISIYVYSYIYLLQNCEQKEPLHVSTHDRADIFFLSESANVRSLRLLLILVLEPIHSHVLIHFISNIGFLLTAKFNRTSDDDERRKKKRF